MARKKSRTYTLDHECRALVLQGGGAVGAYQAGVYEELAATPYLPHWIVGMSIGAINAALIAGNKPENRIARLREFWHLVSSGTSLPPPPGEVARAAFNRYSAGLSTLFGVPGFYRPRPIAAPWHANGSEEALSVYDLAPLRETLERLVDFDLINRKPVRLSLGAVNIRTGNSLYFDNLHHTIGPEHVMASTALPPAFPPIVIDGESYWDGGIVSNTPLQHVLDTRDVRKLLVLQTDLFSASGALPANLLDVVQRHKEIMYSSRTRYSTDKVVEVEALSAALQNLIAKLPSSMRNDPDVIRLKARTDVAEVDVVHLVYRQKRYERESRENDFSRAAVLEHWQAGVDDMRQAREHPDWLARSSLDAGVTTYDLDRRA
jgi:NTE family protein